jgi:hypothetical protein
MDEQERVGKFFEEYNELCARHGLTITATPAFVQRDDGTYSVVVKTGFMELPKEESDG